MPDGCDVVSGLVVILMAATGSVSLSARSPASGSLSEATIGSDDAWTVLVSSAIAGGGPSTTDPALARLLTMEVVVDRIRAALVRNGSRSPGFPDRETLLAIGSTGIVLERVEGGTSETAVGQSLDERLRQPGAGIILVHNHPRGVGLSASDLGQLAKPGVAGIVAVGHDGSVYGASAGPRYDSRQFETWLFPLAQTEMIRFVRNAASSSTLDTTALQPHMEHAIASALEKARVIRYRAALADARRDSYQRLTLILGHGAESVGKRFALAVGKGGRPNR